MDKISDKERIRGLSLALKVSVAALKHTGESIDGLKAMPEFFELSNRIRQEYEKYSA